MESLNFPGATLKIGGNQTDVYNVIHAYPLDGPEGEVIAIYQLSEEELREINETKQIFYSRLTFRNECTCQHCGKKTQAGFQPMRLSTDPIAINVQMIDEKGDSKPVLAYVTATGLQIPGYQKTEEGKYVPVQ